MNKHLAEPKVLRSKIRKCECSFKFSSDADILVAGYNFFFFSYHRNNISFSHKFPRTNYLKYSCSDRSNVNEGFGQKMYSSIPIICFRDTRANSDKAICSLTFIPSHPPHLTFWILIMVHLASLFLHWELIANIQRIIKKRKRSSNILTGLHKLS